LDSQVRKKKKMKNPEWINTVSILSDSGQSREFNLFSGDMFSWEADLFVVSTHNETMYSVHGKVLDEIYNRFSVEASLEQKKPFLMQDSTEVFFPGFLDEKKRKQWVLIRVPYSAISGLPESFDGFQLAVSLLFSAVASKEHLGLPFKRISMPVIAGQRLMKKGLDVYRRALRIIIEETSRWLKVSRNTETVNLFVYEEDQVPLWNQAMNEVLGREILESKNHELIKILQDQVLEQLEQLASKSHSDTFIFSTLKPLKKEIQSANPYLETILGFSRRVLEGFLKDTAQKNGLRMGKDLRETIEQLEKRLKLAPWFKGYLDIIRIAGNNSVHYPKDGYIPEKLKNGDLIAVYSALTNMLDFWIDQIDSPE